MVVIVYYDWKAWHQYYNPLTELRMTTMKKQDNSYDVKIVNFTAIKVAVLEHRAAPELLGQSIQRFIGWRRENKLPPSISRTFNLAYDDPATTEPENYRFDLCASITTGTNTNNYGVIDKVIPSGKCAVIRNIGPDDELSNIANYLYGEWLEQSGEALRDFPLFFERVSFFPEVSEHQMITDIYLPLI